MQRNSTSGRNQITDRNDTVIRALFERVYSKGELSRIDDIVTPDFAGESTDSPHVHLGPNGLRSHVLRLRTTFYALTMEIDELYMQDDTFVVSWTAQGTQERSFQGTAPTITIGRAGEEPHGNFVTISGKTSGTIRDGRIHESRIVWNADERGQQFRTSVEDTDPEQCADGRTGPHPSLVEEIPVGILPPRPTSSHNGGS